MKTLSIVGASGHGKVVADIAKLNGYDEIEFFDDNRNIKSCGKWPVNGSFKDALATDGDIFIAVGKADIRKRMMDSIGRGKLVTLIHPKAVVAEDVIIGRGTVIMAGAVINPNVTIGQGCIVNTCSSIDHDCIIGDFVHVSVGAHLSGTVNVSDGTWVGAGAVVSNNVNICGECVIGAGAVVIGDIVTPGTYVGVPAKQIVKG